MKGLCIAVFICVAAVTLGSVVPGDDRTLKADHDFLTRQKAILEVLHHVQQRMIYKEHLKVAQEYSIDEHLDQYTNVKAVKEFLSLYRHGLLPRGEIFSIFYERQRDEAIALFHVFYYAKDWDTFYKTMVWARDHVNEGMFVYALTVATLHREDLRGIVLPAPYEIYPYYFVSSDVIHQAYLYKMEGFSNLQGVRDRTVVIPANYTGWYVRLNQEQRLSYFTEDIGLNSYYYYFNADYPAWMGGQEYGLMKDYRGEMYLFYYQQLLARYYLERLSNGLGEIPVFSWAWPVKTGYYPSLRYANGLDFPVRPNNYEFRTEQNILLLQEVEDYEHRIRAVIDTGYITLPGGNRVDFKTPEAIDYIGLFIQSNPDSPDSRYYRHLLLIAKTILGGAYKPVDDYKIIPSVLEHYETALRDPIFYQLYKRIVRYYYQFKHYLPRYTYKDLFFDGVKITSVEIDKLITYFEDFDLDISNSLYYTEEELLHEDRYYKVKAQQKRLTHKPFSYKLEVSSDREVESVIRVFIGPKYDEYGKLLDISENRENFFQVDQFKYTIPSGKTVLKRKSSDFYISVKDRTSSRELYQKVLAAYQDQGEFLLDQSRSHCGFPERLILPRGNRGGFPVQFYFIVSPYKPFEVPLHQGYNEIISCGIGSGARYMDNYSLGYPFDREIRGGSFYTPNMYFKEVPIFHKHEYEINVVV